MSKIKPQPGIDLITLYEGGAAALVGISNVVKLSSNENPFGPSNNAVEAFRRVSHDLHRYPSSDQAALRIAIADAHNLDADRIICGVGSDEVISFLCQAYAGLGDEVIHTEHGFALYRICALAASATPVEVKERERITDVDAILNACTLRTRLVFIANPNNPTGTMISEAEIIQLADALPEHVLLVLDGAYAEYISGFDGGAKLVESRENVFMTRTFSKLYGLGGLRVGWGYGPKDIIKNLNRIRGPFNLSAASLAAAEAAVADKKYIEKCRLENNRLRTWLAEALAEHGVVSDTSMTNFILARFAAQEEATSCDAYLKSQGLIVRQVSGYKLPNCLRVTIGDESACRRVAHAVGQFREGAR
jgi:histidinol-phosphate aminotransferase